MTISDKILPIRFYDDLYDQNRFNKTCHETCQLDLVYPASKLPHFQLKRDSIFALPSSMFLRNVCNDIENNYYKEVPEGVDNLCNKELAEEVLGEPFPKQATLETIIPAQFYLVDLFDIDCCKIKMLTDNIPNNVTLQYPSLGNPIIAIPISSDTEQYHFKIVVDKLEGTSTITVKNGGNTIGVISAAGSYEYNFMSTGFNIELVFGAISSGDYLEVNYFQATKLMFNTVLTDDVALSPSDIQVVNLKDGTDILVYCSPTSYTSNINFGQYYYVIKSGGVFYFSEVFKIVSLKDIEKLYQLKWNHDCDLNSSILYAQQTISCTFENILYLDAGLITPEYDTIEDVDVNGQGDQTARFKRWQKNITLEIGKSPQFLTDALSAVFLHKNITLLEPLNYKQDVQNNLHSVLKVTSEITDIILECYQSVNLRLLLEDKVTDTACCNLAEIIDCEPCDFTAAADQEGCGEPGYGYWIEVIDGNLNWWSDPCPEVPRYSYTLRDCNGNVINPREDQVICYDGRFIRLGWFEGRNCFDTADVQFYYVISEAPILENILFSFSGLIATGTLIPNTFGQAYFQPNCTGPWILVDTFSVGDDGTFSFLYPTDLFTPYLPEDTFCFKISNVSLHCDFGDTNTVCVGSGCIG